MTDVDFSVANMEMVDAACRIAGMEPRRPATRVAGRGTLGGAVVQRTINDLRKSGQLRVSPRR